MKCIKCGRPACLDIRRHNAAFCPEHLLEHLRDQVVKSVKKFKMFNYKEKILVAISGGKDSLALWDILLEEGFKADGLYIDLGIENYSQISKEKARAFAVARGALLQEVSLRELYGVDVGVIAKRNRRTYCSACGLVKRYIMNLVAAKGGYAALATGHNMDDEAASLLGNVLHWQVGYLERQSPNMPADSKGLARKVKPLCRLTERETAAYCLVKGIDYILDECPMAEGARSLLHKEVLNHLERVSPGTKEHFYHGFLREGQKYFRHCKEQPELVKCRNCGQPTTAELCSFCRQMQRADLDPLKIHALLA